MRIEPICIAGDGWGAVAAYKGLKMSFKNIEVCTSDTDLIAITDNNDLIINNLDDTHSNEIICAGYKPVINKQFLQKKNIINIHYSLLPKYRGLHSTVWAILNDEEYLGLSVHLMNEYIDDGPILLQYKVKNDNVSTATHYMNLFNEWITENIGSLVIRYLEGKVIPKEQNFNSATWVGKRSLEDCKINFMKNHVYIKNLFRALNQPYPRPFFRLKGKSERFIVSEITILNRKIDTHIGRILNIDNKGIYVSSLEGYLILSKIEDTDGNKVDNNNFKIGNFLE